MATIVLRTPTTSFERAGRTADTGGGSAIRSRQHQKYARMQVSWAEWQSVEARLIIELKSISLEPAGNLVDAMEKDSLVMMEAQRTVGHVARRLVVSPVTWPDDWQELSDRYRVVLSGRPARSSEPIPILPIPIPPRELPVMRVGCVVGFGMIFASILLLPLSVGLGLAGMFLGASAFALANYAAYGLGERDWIFGPVFASRASLASLFLAVVAVVAALTD